MKKKIAVMLVFGMFFVFPIVTAQAITIEPNSPYNEVLQVEYLGSLVLDLDFSGFESDMVQVTLGAYGLGSFMEPVVLPVDQDSATVVPVSFFDEFDLFGRVVLQGADFLPISRTDFQATVPFSTEYSYQLKIQHVGRAFDTPTLARIIEDQFSPASVRLEMSAQAAPVPEPATMLLLGTGLVGIASIRKKMKK